MTEELISAAEALITRIGDVVRISYIFGHDRMQNHSAFARDIHLALSSLVTYLRETNTLAVVNGRCISTRSGRGSAARNCKVNEYSPGKTVEQNYDMRKLKNSIYDKESIFPGLNRRETVQDLPFTEPGDLNETKNYYNIRDRRDLIQSHGFELDDPRSRFSNRDDATEEIEFQFDGNGRPQLLGDVAPIRVKLNRRCIVTKVTTTVDVPVNQLTGKDVLSALLYNIPQYSKFKTVESMYQYIQTNDVAKGAAISLDSTVLYHLKKQICLLARTKMLKLRESMAIALILDAHNLMEPELRDAWAVSLQSQLYVFRPYDIAATVSILGKYERRYHGLLNTLGLVFYDHMLAGKTSVVVGGPSKEEIMAVLKAYAKAQFPVKRVIDAGFGSLYKNIDSLTTQEMIDLFDDFFALSKDANFVELITHIMAKIFRQPALFVDKFQLWAEEQLNTDFQAPAEAQIATTQDITDSYTPMEVLAIMRALSVCNSEYLIQSVHYRIAFKRLWSDNINKRNMPWQGPVIEPHDQVDAQTNGTAVIESTNTGATMSLQNLKDQNDVTVGLSADDSSKTANDMSEAHMDKKDSSRRDTVITYRDQLPALYKSILRIMSDTLKFVPHPERYLKRIYDSNCKIVDKATSKHEFVKEIRQSLESICTACYPFKVSLYSYAKRFDVKGTRTAPQTELLPFFKNGCDLVGEREETTEDYVLLFHAQQLVKSMLEALGMEKEAAACDDLKNTANLSNVVAETLTEESVRGISLGTCAQGDGNVELVRSSACDMANAIAAICDYSRYANDCHDNTVALLGALYFRILFVNIASPGNARAHAKAAAFERFFECATPTSLMVEIPHLPFTENTNMMGETEFHQTGHAEYRYYRPSPLYTDLVRGNSALYGLMMYAFAHKLQCSMMQAVADDDSPLRHVSTVTTALEHVLHPFYLLTRISNTMLRWQMLYYNGMLNKCHEFSSMVADWEEGANPTNETNGDESQAGTDLMEQKGDSGFDTSSDYLKSLCNTIYGILDEAVDSVTAGIAQVMRCPYFRHAATALVNVCISYIKGVMHEVAEDSKLLCMREYAELSTALSMLIAFDKLLDDSQPQHRMDSLMLLKERITASMIKEVIETGKGENAGAPEVDASHGETGDTSDIYKGHADFVDTLSQQLDEETFMHTAHALSMASNGASDSDEFVDTLHSMMQVMYKRLTYMSSKNVLRALVILGDLNETMQYAEECHAEDPRGRLAQVARILREQAMELLAKPPAHTEDGERLSAVGRCVLRHGLP